MSNTVTSQMSYIVEHGGIDVYSSPSLREAREAARRARDYHVVDATGRILSRHMSIEAARDDAQMRREHDGDPDIAVVEGPPIRVVRVTRTYL